MAVKKISKVQPEKFEFNKKNKETADSVIKNYDFKNVYLEKIIPFASDFYFVTRIIYARLCKEFLKEKPTYDHPLEKIASSLVGLPVTDKYSQIQTYIFKKK